jgi:hypothetical protein
MLITLLWQFLSPDFVTDQNYHRSWSTQKSIILPCMCNTTVQKVNRTKGFMAVRCEVPSEDCNALGSPLPVPLRVTPHDAVYRNCFVILPYFVAPFCCSPMKQQLSLFMVCHIVCLLFEFGLGIQTFCYLAISKNLEFQLHQNKQCLLCNISENP